MSLGSKLVKDALKGTKYIVQYTPHMGKTRTSGILSKKEAEEFASSARRAKDSYDVKIIPVREEYDGWRRLNEDY